MRETDRKAGSALGFCAHGPTAYKQSEQGQLAGLKVAVKDLFALQGHKNGAGNPDWYEMHAPAEVTAESLAKLLAEGAEFSGFTHTDELAYSLEGNNHHYGATENPKVTGRACGGSSMGSAAAVAADAADIGLGTDTGGSIRVPSSYCGLYGIRPSHGAVSVDGLIGLAPRFDTVGWMTRNAELLAKVGEVLLPQQPQHAPEEFLLDEKLFDLLENPLQRLMEVALQQCSNRVNKLTTIDLGTEAVFSELADIFRILQGRDIANYHRQWLQNEQPTLSAPIQARIDMALAITDAEVKDAEQTRAAFNAHLAEVLPSRAALFLPTTPTVAPKLKADTTQLRPRLLKLTAIAGLTGSAQVHLPLLSAVNEEDQRTPFGFSLLMRAGQDRSLLSLVKALANDWEK